MKKELKALIAVICTVAICTFINLLLISNLALDVEFHDTYFVFGSLPFFVTLIVVVVCLHIIIHWLGQKVTVHPLFRHVLIIWLSVYLLFIIYSISLCIVAIFHSRMANGFWKFQIWSIILLFGFLAVIYLLKLTRLFRK